MIHQLTEKILSLIQQHGGMSVFIGVIAESIIVPIPSPTIIMGAGAILIDPSWSGLHVFKAIVYQIVLPGSVASTLGAYFGYAIGYYGGKPAIDRWHHFFGFTWDDLQQRKEVLQKHTAWVLLSMRALPIIPLSLISASAGLVRIPLGVFTLWTFLGSIPRCLIMAYLGYWTRNAYAGFANQLNQAEGFFSGLIVLVMVVLIFYMRFRLRKKH